MKSKVICVIMGGGRGTRLYPLTKMRAKPAVPLAGKYRLADIPISNCLNSGYNHIYLLTQFNTASLHRHIQESYQFDPFAGGFVHILSAEQTEEREGWYQGTADAVRQNLMHFGGYSKDDLFIILSGDQLYRMDLREIVEHHNRVGSDVTIAAKPFPMSSVSEFGVMRVNDDYSVQEFVEKPTDPNVVNQLVVPQGLREQVGGGSELADHCLVSMGIYVFKADILMEALESDSQDFGKEIIPNLLKEKKLYSFIFDGYWEDIGTVRSFWEANLRLTDTVPPFNFFEPHKPVFTHARYLPASKINECTLNQVIVSDGSIITKAYLQRVVVGIRSMIGENTRLENVVMMGADKIEDEEDREVNRVAGIPDIGIGNDSFIRNAIIDKDARIGNNVHLDPEGKPDCYIHGDVIVRDGVIIVPKKGIIPDGTRF